MNKPNTTTKRSKYGWGEQKITRSQKREIANIKPIPPAVMAKKLIERHNKEYALRAIVLPNSLPAFKDSHGNPVTPNPAAKYWDAVRKEMK